MTDTEKLLRDFIEDVKYIAGKHRKISNPIQSDDVIEYLRLFRGLENQASIALVKLEELLKQQKES